VFANSVVLKKKFVEILGLPVGAGGPFRQTQKSGKRGKEEEKEEGKKKGLLQPPGY
jgi:hypothetical protein